MKVLTAILFLNFSIFAQSSQEVANYNNSIVKSFNEVTEKILIFNSLLMQGAATELLIQNKNELLKQLNTTTEQLQSIKPLEHDYGFLSETKAGCLNYKKYVLQNYSDEKLKIIPTTARENIKKIKTAQQAAAEMEKWNTQFSKRQQKLLSTHNISSASDSKLKQKADLHKAAMNHYYLIAINEFKVQAFIDDFIDAMNNGDKKGVKIAADKLNAQIVISDAFFKRVKTHDGDKSLIETSKTTITFYKKLQNGLVKNTISLNNYPEEIPNEKIDDYNNLVNEINAGIEFLNTLQNELNKSQKIIHAFFKRHLV